MDLFTKFWNVRTMKAHLGNYKKEAFGGKYTKEVLFYIVKSNFIVLRFLS